MAFEWGSGGTIAAGGATLECASYGPSPDKAPTLVLLHEGLGCVALWRDFPEKLAAATGWGVFVYSRLGYGKSDPVTLPRPLDFMTCEAKEVLPELLDTIRLEYGVLLGHSDGATIAAIYGGSVLDHRVRGLILMAPHFFTEAGGLAEIAKAKEAYESGNLKEKLAKYHEDPDGAFKGWNDVWLAEGFRDWDVADVIDYLRIPVLAIQGREDQYGTLAQVEVIEERTYCPCDLLVLDDCKHSPHQDQPDQVIAAVAEFTGRLARIEAAEVETA